MTAGRSERWTIRTWSVVCIAAVVSVACAVWSLNDPPVGDEMVFFGAVRAAAETGRPLFYKSVQFGDQWGVWHPPTYVYAVASGVRVFGIHHAVVRGLTFVATLATLPLLVALAGALTDLDAVRLREGWKVWQFAGLALLLYVLSPLVIQNGTLVDIDGSLLPLAVVGFVLYVIRTFERPGPVPRSRYVGLAVLFAAVSWVKFGPLPVLVVSLGGYLLLRGDYRNLVPAIGSLFAGFGLFSVTWRGVASLLDLPFWKPYDHNFGMLLSGGGGRDIALATRAMLSGWTGYASLLWLSPFLVLLACGALLVGAPRRPSVAWLRDRAPLAFVGAVGALTYAQYTVLAKLPYGFPKYMGIVTPLFAVLAAVCVASVLPSPLERPRLWGANAGAAAVVAVVTVLAPDPFYVSFNEGIRSVLARTLATVTAYVGGFALVSGVATVSTERLDRSSLAAIGLVVLLLGTNGGLILTQATAGYSTHYNYGQTGSEETLAYVEGAYADLPPEERSAVVVPFDIGLRLGEPYHDTELYSVSDLEADDPPLVVVKNRKYYAVESPLLTRLRSHPDYTERTVGAFSIFVRRGEG